MAQSDDNTIPTTGLAATLGTRSLILSGRANEVQQEVSSGFLASAVTVIHCSYLSKYSRLPFALSHHQVTVGLLVSLEDAYGASASATVNVVVRPAPRILAAPAEYYTTVGFNNGAFILTITGGTPPIALDVTYAVPL